MEVDSLERASWLPAVTAFGIISGKHLFWLEPVSCPQLKLGSNLIAQQQYLATVTAMWWVHQLGGRQQRGQLFGAMAVVHVRAAVLASAATRLMDKAERRFRDPVGCGQRCRECVTSRSSDGSFAPLTQAFWALGGLGIAYSPRYARAYAPLARDRSLVRARWIAR